MAQDTIYQNWDSDFFGFNVGKISIKIGENIDFESFKEIQKKYTLLYIFCDYDLKNTIFNPQVRELIASGIIADKAETAIPKKVKPATSGVKGRKPSDTSKSKIVNALINKFIENRFGEKLIIENKNVSTKRPNKIIVNEEFKYFVWERFEKVFEKRNRHSN